MAARQYYPTLVRILRGVCVYIVRYRVQLEKVLDDKFGAQAVIALGAVLTACEQFVAQVEIEVKP